jgi:hypothetical protein
MHEDPARRRAASGAALMSLRGSAAPREIIHSFVPRLDNFS